ncbi:MAG TPA: N-methyl-L-tryptophan oxidase [Terracidiphilus sp.]|nr:N-methyl-L-tryptophan oxidase [Terracidiphilus sp.]
MSVQDKVIVVGLGAMGSAVTYHLARRGYRVLGLDQFDVPHDKGSSHGITRIIRLAYFEHPSYVPLLLRAYQLWRQLEHDLGSQLLWITGSLDIGAVCEDSRRSCELHSLPHEILTAAEIARRFPAYQLPSDLMGLLQPEGGFLAPEACISAHLRLAGALGAELHGREPVLEWEETKNTIHVRTSRDTYEADFLVVTAGAWVSKLVPALSAITKPERQVLAWLQPKTPGLFQPSNFPVFNLRLNEGHFYGFPEFGVPGFKFGRYHHRHENVDPDTMKREADSEDERLLRDFAMRYFPEGAGPTLALHTCLFTNTPDEHFLLDFHPESRRVVIGSPCSGHGFKFSSVVGEVLADLVEHGDTHLDISMHRFQRFAAK